MAYEIVNEDNVHLCAGHPLSGDIVNIITWLLNENFSIAYRRIVELKTMKGLALNDILTEVHAFVIKSTTSIPFFN